MAGFGNQMDPVRFTPSRGHRFHLLDALRGIAAVFVVPIHAPLELAGSVFFPNAPLAVDFFFCLSGFVIAYSYERRLEAQLGMRDFLIARAIRLYPMALLGTVIGLSYSLLRSSVWSGLPAGTLLPILALSLLMLPMLHVPWFNGALYPFNIPAWSLLSEVLANTVYVSLVRLRIAQNRVLAAIAFCSLAVLAHAARSLPNIGGGFTSALAYVGFARVGFSFFVGVLLFRLHQSNSSFAFRRRHGAVLAVAIILIMVATLTTSRGASRSSLFSLFAITVIFPCMVMLGSKVELPQAWTKTSAWLGDMSYPLYMLHFSLLLPLSSLTVHRFAGHHLWFARLAVPSCLVCLASWVGANVDAPIRRYLARKYDRGQKKRSAVLGARTH